MSKLVNANGFTLQFNDDTQCLELINTVKPKQKPFYIDFTSGKTAYRIKQGIGRNQPLPKAIGIKKDYLPTVLDVTAGLGRDSFILASCGCQVTLLERSDILFELLHDALQRAALTDLHAIVERMHLFHDDALRYLLALSDLPEVIYLDPMYPERNKTALVKQEMRIVRDIVGDDHDSNRLFELALEKASKRVVVKRHRLAEPLSGPAPTYNIMGKTTRFDIYLVS